MQRQAWSWTLLLSLAVLPSTGRAEATQAEDLSLEDLLSLKVETSTRRLEPFAWIPASSIIVTRYQIEARHYVNLKDLLKDLPGVDVYDNYSETAHALVSLRGSPGNNQFVVLVNGHRITPVTHDKREISFDDNFPLFGAKQVEVVFGPASALYGSDAFTGVINIITEDESESRSGSAAIAYGSNNAKYGAARAAAKLGERVALRVGGHWQDSDNTNLAKEYPDKFPLDHFEDPFSGEVLPLARNDTYSHRTRSFSVNAEATLDQKFTVGYDLRRFNMQSGESVKPQYTLYGPESQFIWQTAYARYRTRLSDALSSETNLSYSTYRKGPNFAYNNVFSGFQTVWHQSKDQAFDLEQQLSYDLTDAHNLIVGASYLHVVAFPDSGDLSRKPDDDVPLANQGIDILGTDLPTPVMELNYTNLGAYAQLQSQWTPKLSTTLGLRYDHDTRFGSTFNPRAGVVFRASNSHTFKLLYGESFLAPSPSEAYTFWGEFDSTDPVTHQLHSSYYHVPNPALGPMKARTVEANYTMLLGQHFMSVVSAYFTAVSGQTILYNLPNPVPFAGGIVDAPEIYASIGRNRIWGGDVTLRYQRSFGPVALESWASYTLSLGRTLAPSGPETYELPYNTPHKFKGGLTLQYGRVRFTSKFRHSGYQTHSSFDPADATKRLNVPPYTVFDAALDVAIVGGLSATFDARNLFDSHYFQPGGDGPQNFVANPQDTRTLMLQLTYRY